MESVNPCRILSMVSTLMTLATLASVLGLVAWVKPHYDAAKSAATGLATDAIPAAFVLPSLAELETLALGTHDQLESTFKSWAKAHGKTYESREEYKRRLANFATSAKAVFHHNSRLQAGSSSHVLGLTEYADMSDAEFMAHFGLDSPKTGQECSATQKWQTAKPATNVAAAAPADDSNLPTRIDWRESGIVSPVKNQGHCGSCWTFSAVGALEAFYLKKHHKFVNMSEQQLLDCAGNYDNHGCNGGLPSHAFQYLAENGGIDRERAYPYQATETGSCKFKKWSVATKVASVVNITQFDEKELQQAVGTVGPVSVAFQVISDFRLYAGGVYASPACKNGAQDVNHAVLAVGYDTAPDGTPYWIIKNSWGKSWGMNGYFHMKRGVNQCGIAACCSYPVLA